ncbi:MAG: HNH endonuclease [Microcystis aeruginosa Ma_MB_S_20031200_S102]|uniref:HNH endonuclease n=1 Tax=Microcystis aeruginosa Ma_MB_S_20031200_S102 TaxID=2486254 RepID=A0A552EB21_MICAE|nr:MAG: HNH endonuclease [Microcystis aeruginosa Ma_MB_S_20031200_S102D]TRU31573.1 MAG: HNH endonuclease [Microcystis aeruginosa Ma_MB_S_20031200_S102]
MTYKVFLKEKKVNRQMDANLVKKAFPPVPYSENKHINVRGDYSPFNGDLVYWSKRQSKLDNGATSRTLIRQKHTCGYCGLKFIDEEKIQLHHINRNHSNSRANNLLAVHESCQNYIHRCKSES